MKRSFGVLLAFILLSTMLISGCSQDGSETGKGETTTGTTTTTSITTKEGDPVPDTYLTLQPAELTISCGDNHYSPASFADNLEIFQAIEADTNVKINWDVYPSSQWNEVVQTMLAAGMDLADIIVGSFNVSTYYYAGLFLDMKPLIDQHAPDIQTLFGSKPIVKVLCSLSDGAIPKLGFVYAAGDFERTWMIRKDWLDKIEHDIPTTTDELYEVLKLFYENDMNGNGIANDEVPLSFDGPWSSVDGVLGSFGIRPNTWFPDENGVMQWSKASPGTYEFWFWMNKLHSEKLLNQNFQSDRGDAFWALAANEQLGVTNTWMATIDMLNSLHEHAEWVGMLPLVGPTGIKGTVDIRTPLGGNVVITRDASDPVLAIKWLNYLFSEKGTDYTNWGILDKSYTIGVDGNKQYTDFVMNNPSGLSAVDALRSLGARPSIPFVLDSMAEAQFVSDHVREFNEMLKPYLIDCFPHHDVAIIRTESETKAWNALNGDIDSFANEHYFGFIDGSKPLTPETWEKYIADLHDMKFEALQAMEQVMYERFLTLTR